jgi:hypothetical protein
MENIGTIIVAAILILIVGAIIFTLVRNKRQGKSTCSACDASSTCPSCNPGSKKTG